MEAFWRAESTSSSKPASDSARASPWRFAPSLPGNLFSTPASITVRRKAPFPLNRVLRPAGVGSAFPLEAGHKWYTYSQRTVEHLEQLKAREEGVSLTCPVKSGEADRDDDETDNEVCSDG